MKIKGAFPVRWAAQDGAPGTGVTIVQALCFTKYASSSSGTTHPADSSSDWKTSVPTVANGNYLWTWTHVHYSDGTHTDSYSVSRMGIDGVGIISSVTKYCQKANTNTAPENFPESDWGAFPTNLMNDYWLYTRTIVTYSNQDTAISYDVAQIGQGSYYAGCQEYYCVSNDGDNAPSGYPNSKPFVDGVATYANGEACNVTGSWSTSKPTANNSTPYIWNFEISADSRGNRYVTQAICIGNFAKGIASIVESYAVSAYGTPESGRDYPSDIAAADWQDEQHAVAPTNAKRYQWNRTTVNYNNGSPDVFYHVSAVKGADGAGATYLYLDNENDSMLYDGAGNLVSGNVVANAKLLVGADDKTSDTSWALGTYSGMDSTQVSISGNTVTVTGMSADASSGFVDVVGTYGGQPYTKRLTLKKLRGVDKFELIRNPSALTYNSNAGTGAQQEVNIKVYRTAQNGARTLVESLSTYGLKLRYYWITNGVDAGPTYITDGTAENYYNGGVTRSVYADRYTAYRYEVLNSGGLILDSETVPISKVSDGIGTPGASAKSIYKNSFMNPSTPTGSSPSGWNNNHSEQAEIKVQAQGDWYLTDDGFLTAPLIGNGQTSVETLSFITTQANQSVFLRLRCNTSSNDRVYIGNVDSVAPTTNYYREFHGSYQDSGDLSISVANAGLHFISIAYVRGSSGTSEFVKFICGSMYVWKSDALTFNTDGTVATWSTPYKISGKDAAFTTAVKTNLLLQSSFISTRMDKWAMKNGATAGGIEGRNCYTGTPDISVEKKELLQQTMYDPDGEERLLANTWYTLSFWAKADPFFQVDKYITSPNYGFAQQTCHFEAGVESTVTFNGYCSSAARNAGKYLRVYVFNADWSWSVNAAITSTTSTSYTLAFSVPSTGEYYIEAYVYKNGGDTPVSGQTCTLNWYRINRGMRMVTYLYPSNSNNQTDDTCIDVGAGRIIEGIPTGSSSPTDNNVEWQLTEEWTKHTVTFKTRSYIPSKIQSFLVRMHQASNGISICMPKIEQGTVATDYCTNDSDIADFAADETGFPNDRNIWVDAPDEPYIWNEERRDYIAYEINGEWKRYFVKSKGMTVPKGFAPSAGGNRYWSEGSRINTLLVNTIVGANAELRFAKTNRLFVAKSDGSTVAAGLGGAEGGDNDYPLWIGATYANRANAPFKVTLIGKLYATQAEITGKIIATSGSFSGSNNGFSIKLDADNRLFSIYGPSGTASQSSFEPASNASTVEYISLGNFIHMGSTWGKDGVTQHSICSQIKLSRPIGWAGSDVNKQIMKLDLLNGVSFYNLISGKETRIASYGPTGMTTGISIFIKDATLMPSRDRAVIGQVYIDGETLKVRLS